jgi:hypothetical protein
MQIFGIKYSDSGTWVRREGYAAGNGGVTVRIRRKQRETVPKHSKIMELVNYSLN